MIDPEEFNERQEKLFELVKFFSRLLLVGLFFRLILWIYPDTSGFQAFTAEIITFIMNLIGYNFSVEGFRILTSGVDYIITQDCTGWKSGMALIGLVYASTGKLMKHCRFLALGLLGIFVANLIRVVTTIMLADAGIISFDIVHGFLWRWGLTAVVFAIWAFWYRGLEDEEDEAESSAEDVGDE
jgi:exosortase/archaeosortase family protein